MMGGGDDGVMSGSVVAVQWWMGYAARTVTWRVLSAAQGSESDGIGVSVF
jgi:hypothetical protein